MGGLWLQVKNTFIQTKKKIECDVLCELCASSLNCREWQRIKSLKNPK